MQRFAAILLAALGCGAITRAAAQQDIKPLPSVQVTAPNDVADVQALNDALTALSEKVTACVTGGGKPETCRCSYPPELARLRKIYADVVRQHPGWKDQLLSYRYLNKEGRNINQGRVAIGHLGIDIRDPDMPALRIMAYILGAGGFSSRLVQRVRTDEGLAYDVGAGCYPGVLYPSLQTVPSSCTAFRADLASTVQWRRLYRAVDPCRHKPLYHL